MTRSPRTQAPQTTSGAGEGSEGEHPAKDTQLIVGLTASLRLLDEFTAAEGRPLAVDELAARLDIRPSIVAAAAGVLVAEGILERVPGKAALTLGGGALALGLTALSSTSVKRAALPRMQKLASDARFNVGLGTRDRLRMVYVEACESEALVGLRLFAGSRVPILTTAMGRAYLAALPPGERDALLDELRPHHKEGWPALVEGVRQAIRDLEAQGFCVSAGDWHEEIHGVAAPIRSPDGQLFVINLGGPAYMLPVRILVNTYGPKVAELTRAVEHECFVGSGADPASRWSRKDIT